MPRTRTFTAAAFAVLMGFTMISPASAAVTTSHVGGGTWYHGTTSDGMVVSNYYHPTKRHHSTAVGRYTVRKTAYAGMTSWARAPRANQNNQTYYGVDE